MQLLASPSKRAPLTQPGYLRHLRCTIISSFLLRQEIPCVNSCWSEILGPSNLQFFTSCKQRPINLGRRFNWPRQTPGSRFLQRDHTSNCQGRGIPTIIFTRFQMTAAVGSASFYPIKGFFYLWRSEGRGLLWKRVAIFAAEVTAASAAVLAAIVIFTFHVQHSLIAQVVPDFFGTPGTIILILIETAIPVGLLFYHRLRRTQDKIFDDVLSLQNVSVQKASPDEKEWIDEQREIQWQQSQDASTPRTPVGAVTNPKALDQHPVRKYFLTLPLNFIPVVGTIAFCYMNAVGTSAGLHHHYYSHLKELTEDEEAVVIQSRQKQYQQFGLMASALTLIPGVDAVLVLTNAIGAALWAADLEG